VTRVEAARPRILCVDDDPSMLGGLSAVLRRDFDVCTAASGPDGLRALTDEGPFPVVVSDLAMPGMSGVEFLALVASVAPNAVRVLLTGHASLEAAVAAVNEGNIFRFLVKPCRPDELIKALKDGVEQARLVTADCELLERRLEAMSGHLLRAERLASLGTLAGAVGHELNNLLATFDCALGIVVEEAENGRVPGATYLAALAHVQEGLRYTPGISFSSGGHSPRLRRPRNSERRWRARWRRCVRPARSVESRSIWTCHRTR